MLTNTDLIEKLDRLKDIGKEIAGLSTEAKLIRAKIVENLKVMGFSLPKPPEKCSRDEETGPPLKIIVDSTVISISEARITKDYNITFEVLPQFTEEE